MLEDAGLNRMTYTVRKRVGGQMKVVVGELSALKEDIYAFTHPREACRDRSLLVGRCRTFSITNELERN